MPQITENQSTGGVAVTGQVSKLRQFRRNAWNSFKSKSPKWVVFLQGMCVAVGGYGATLQATHFTIKGLSFLNDLAPEMIEASVVAGVALQFIQRVESAILAPGDTIRNETDKPVQVDVPTEQ
jgi:hypothetical protein